MRSYDADNTYDQKELGRLNAEPWQIALLGLNPSYNYWGCEEDSMCGKDAGWRSPIFFDNWESCDLGLDDLNEVVHFHFEVDRDSKECSTCGGDGYHPDAKHIADGFYDFAGEGRDRWDASITQDEVQALVDHHRLIDFTHEWRENKWQEKNPPCVPTAAEVNTSQGMYGSEHDAINRHILIEARLRRLGLPSKCNECTGHGYVYTAPSAHVSLTMWLLHPRKGASRGVEVKRIERTDLPEVFAFLKEAADRNAERFAKVVAASKTAVVEKSRDTA